MTPKQQRFVAEYLVDLNATQAAIRAGYSAKTAGAIGHENLTKPEIQKALGAQRSKLEAQTGITKERVLRELGAVGLSDIRRLYNEDGSFKPIHTLTEEEAAQLAGVEVDEVVNAEGEKVERIRTTKVKRWDKTKALELLGRHLGLWADSERPPNVGPGMIIQVIQGTRSDGNRVTAQRVEVRLPGPRQ